MKFHKRRCQKLLVFTTLFCGIFQVTSPQALSAQEKGQAKLSFTGNVPAECAVIDQFNAINNEASIVIETNNIGFENEDIERVAALSANNSIKFDCNSEEIAIDISLNRIEVPDPDRDRDSVDHTVLVQANGIFVNRNGSAGYSANNLGNVDLVDNGNINTDRNGDAEITVTSNFIDQNKELPQGRYVTVFRVTATPR